jgi:hypothetical protein
VARNLLGYNWWVREAPLTVSTVIWITQGVHVAWFRSCDMHIIYPWEHFRTFGYDYLARDMSGTCLVWISRGLADWLKCLPQRLIWWCNNTTRSKGLQSRPACCFHPDLLPVPRGDLSDPKQQRSSPHRLSSRYLTCHHVGSRVNHIRAEQLGHSLAKEACLGLCMVWLGEYHVGSWYEAWSIPAYWVVMEWQLQQYDLP